MESELDRRRIALQDDVAKLVAQGWRVQSANDVAVTLVLFRQSSAGRKALLFLWVIIAIPTTLMGGIILPVIGWFVCGAMCILAGFLIIGRRYHYRTLTIYDYQTTSEG